MCTAWPRPCSMSEAYCQHPSHSPCQQFVRQPCRQFVSHPFTHPANNSSVTHSLTLPTTIRSPCQHLITHPANTWSSHPATNQSLTALLLLSAASLGFFALGWSGPAAASWLRPRLQRGVGQGREASRGHRRNDIECPPTKCKTLKIISHTEPSCIEGALCAGERSCYYLFP